MLEWSVIITQSYFRLSTPSSTSLVSMTWTTCRRSTSSPSAASGRSRRHLLWAAADRESESSQRLTNIWADWNSSRHCFSLTWSLNPVIWTPPDDQTSHVDVPHGHHISGLLLPPGRGSLPGPRQLFPPSPGSPGPGMVTTADPSSEEPRPRIIQTETSSTSSPSPESSIPGTTSTTLPSDPSKTQLRGIFWRKEEGGKVFAKNFL